MIAMSKKSYFLMCKLNCLPNFDLNVVRKSNEESQKAQSKARPELTVITAYTNFTHTHTHKHHKKRKCATTTRI